MPEERQKDNSEKQEKFVPASFKKPARIEEEEFESKLLDLSRLAHMKAGGRRFRFRAIMVIGDKKGKVGMGIAKGRDVAQAIQKALKRAKKDLISVSVLGHTIPHQVESKFSSARVLLKPQKMGRGLVAGGTIRIICNLCGIKDISSKLLSPTKNKLNIARATISALKKVKLTDKHADTQSKTNS